jgi:hypothetical protein
MQVLRRKSILHRALLVGLCLVLSWGAAAQIRPRKAKGPRALALVEWPASGGSPRVIPVAILVDGRYYDASIYKADPVPLALEPGNVYEVDQSGEFIGMVTLTGARQAKNGAWLADARFQTREQLAASRRPRDVAPKSATVSEAPPTLRRGGRRSGHDRTPAPAPAPEPRPEPQPAGDDAPPVLRRPANEAPSPDAGKPGDAESKTADKVNAPTAPPSPPIPPSADRSEDSEHPVLRRGRPTAEQAENLPGAVEAKAPPESPAAAAGPGSAANKAAATRPGRVLPAISDAAGPEPHTYLLPWSIDEQERLKNSMIQLASSMLQDFARTHGETHPGPLQDVQVRAFDLTTRNEPQIVLMARAVEALPAAPVRRAGQRPGTKPGAVTPPPQAAGEGLTYWITVAARQDYNGDLRKLKVWATDSRHLDAYPRAELIDAVDADGDGRGELLFREISDQGRSFALYRANPDSLTQLYNSAELEH